jgi:hypothetical protein
MTARTVRAFGRSWSHQQMHRLISTTRDEGWAVSVWRDVYYNDEVAEPILSDDVFVELYRLDIRPCITVRGQAKTIWLALCVAIESAADVRNREIYAGRWAKMEGE